MNNDVAKHDAMIRPAWMAKTAHLLSNVFSPLLVPTYGVFLILWLTTMSFLDLSVRWIVVGVVFITTCLLPLIAILGLWQMKVIGDPQLNNRAERSIPYVITAVCYLGCAFYLWRMSAPCWLWGLPGGGSIAVIICLAINHWWKISAHLAAMGGLVAALFSVTTLEVNIIDMRVWLSGAVILAGLVGSARVTLERHTLWQVIAGFAVGFVSVFFISIA